MISSIRLPSRFADIIRYLAYRRNGIGPNVVKKKHCYNVLKGLPAKSAAIKDYETFK